ncbi:hypothetical protein [Streptomyces chattanoogensis]|uniref:hypothetical protein n=1 Tax=Streptomyces chattanoogensis TaxID=66876 RepID=UPI0036ADC07A
MRKGDDDHKWPSADDDAYKWSNWTIAVGTHYYRRQSALIVEKVSSSSVAKVLKDRGFSVLRITEITDPEAVRVTFNSRNDLEPAAEAIREKFPAAKVRII